ncbi:MAG: rhomboid family intramembrane serine protease [Chitinophagia bacterium]|nr:rhomboid family intramembrane serine protease [Chitinophagia bacterium]
MVYLIIIITAIISIAAFSNSALLNKLILYPYRMEGPEEYYRLLTSGFLHADWNHLLFNMLSLYFFGDNVIQILQQIVGGSAPIAFVSIYCLAITVSSVPALIKHRQNSNYSALGASGGVAGIIFFTIYYFPWSQIYIGFIPFGIPAILYGAIYVLYSYFMAQRSMDNIGHEAHLSGALFGFSVALLLDPSHGQYFLRQMQHPVW